MAELNPILVKELRGRMRGVRSFVLLSIFLALISTATLLFYAVMAAQSGEDLNAGRRIGQILFWMIAVTTLIGICIITPLLTAGGLAGERERQTFDLLVASQLSPWQIVLGKLGSALAFALLIVLAVVPLMSLAFLFGGVSLSEVLIVLASLAATCLLYASVGIFWSSLMRSTLGASFLAVSSIAVVLLGIPFLTLIAAIANNLGRDLWGGSAIGAFLSRLFLCIHPFYALYFSETAILTGEGPFINMLFLNDGTTIPAPSGWLMFVVLALLISGILLFFTTRMVRPTAAPISGGKRRKKDE